MSNDAEAPPSPEMHQDAARLAALRELAGAIAHDYNNLLTGILGNLELLHRRAGKFGIAEFDDYLNGARGAANRAVRLNHRLAAIAGHQSMNISAVSVTAILDALAPDITRLLGTGCSLQILQSEVTAQALCDETHLHDAILELVSNARDAMPEEGAVTIAVSSVKIDAHPELTSGDYVMIEVQDSGPGMPPEIAARALEPFFSTRQRGAVSGLGLAAVDSFVRKCGGAIKIICPAPGGACVALYLPRYPD